jgi:D-alanyl-D-alanine carboxypeptidase
MKNILYLLLAIPPCITHAQSPADSLLAFIKNNPARSAIYLVRNDSVVAKQNENKLMPLASTVKILVAVEFAIQAGAGVVDPDEKIAISELDRYYIPFTDGNAHPMWLRFENNKGNVTNDSI